MMNIICALLLVLSAAFNEWPAGNDVDEATTWMSGHFSSAGQAAADSSYFDISLIMTPIWPGDKKVSWLYVEQAVSSMKDKPYRQRVYRLSKGKRGTVESRVYELPNPEDFVQSWQDVSVFDAISPDDLIPRDGCSVYLKRQTDGCFEGSTRDKECLSSLRGATYATSIVQVCDNAITSWDQGWDSSDEQVWGAVKGPYIFNRLDTSDD